MMRDINKTRIVWHLFLCTIFFICTLYLYQYIEKNLEKSIETIVTLFSVLAGFTITILTFSTLTRNDQHWRATEIASDNRRIILAEQVFMFWLYLLTIALIYIATLLPPENIVQEWLERIYFGLSITVFLLSFGIGRSIYKVQDTEMRRIVKNQESKTPEIDTL